MRRLGIAVLCTMMFSISSWSQESVSLLVNKSAKLGDSNITFTFMNLIDKIPATNQFMQPDTGKKLVKLTLRVDASNSEIGITPSSESFEIKDGDGFSYKENMTSHTYNKTPFSDRGIDAGDFGSGTIVIEVPEDLDVKSLRIRWAGNQTAFWSPWVKVQ